MRLFGLTITSGPHDHPRRAEIVSPGGAQEAENLSERLNALENRLERVELDSAERQLAVLSALEKVLNQLRAREVQREKREAEDGEPASDRAAVARGRGGGDGRVLMVPADPPSTAELARRFKRF